MAEPDIDELEIRIAYQDDTITQLSDQLYRQAQAIDRLMERCQRLERRVEQLQETKHDAPADETPPHY